MSVGGLVVAIGVGDELAEQRAVHPDDPDVGIGDQQPDLLPRVRPPCSPGLRGRSQVGVRSSTGRALIRRSKATPGVAPWSARCGR
jgi:hypothetical protein